ncbi:hypothetical protein HIV01_015835 [Lysobacter arenosi]|uniref:Uncharacterized protein n=1 Tax=Lysobacter arenosi TaxID=2795387 RepID=A0ABX7RB66_9GAMM|nr:hypothetical protein [Lysobacter arenosi]QSX74627.1 hypothetical protein HIV01_015835 [Lysobacter arenosi]
MRYCAQMQPCNDRPQSNTDVRSMTHGRDEPTRRRFRRLHNQILDLLERMPRVELSEDGHAAVTIVGRHLFLLIFFMASVHTVQGVLREYRHARAILVDHGIAVAVPAKADTVLDRLLPTGRTDRDLYTFTVDGTTYSASFATDDPTVQVAYANAQPGRFGQLDVLEYQASAVHVVMGTVVAVPAFAIACWSSLAFLMRFVFRIGRWSDFYGRN